jgi:ribosome biogenesis ATPase
LDADVLMTPLQGGPLARHDTTTRATGPSAHVHAVRFDGRLVRRFTDAELAALIVTYDDFLDATKKVQPSAIREGFATIPDVTWADVGALHDVRGELERSIVEAIRRPEV